MEFSLHSGRNIPAIGFGLGTTYRDRSQQDLVSGILKAYDKGYRFFDTAIVYNTEQFLGQALTTLLQSQNVKREDIQITTKIHPRHFNYRQVYNKIDQGTVV